MSDVFVGIGTGPGMGMSTASRFAREGFDLVLASRNVSKLATIAEEIRRETGRRIETISLDATNATALQQLSDRVGDRVGVLHHNAAVMEKTDVFETPVETFHRNLQIDITGAFTTIRSFAPNMENRGKARFFAREEAWRLLPARSISP